MVCCVSSATAIHPATELTLLASQAREKCKRKCATGKYVVQSVQARAHVNKLNSTKPGYYWLAEPKFGFGVHIVRVKLVSSEQKSSF
jgi:hypothetical protein